MSLHKTPHIIAVVGPTASGKTSLSIKLAHMHNGEIVSADSCQIYVGLSLGNGKVTHAEMEGIPHHMLDVIAPTTSLSVSEYQALALPILEDIIARGKTPIIVGGTGQYIDALCFEQSFPPVPPNPELRALLRQKTAEELYTTLASLDPARAACIDKHNPVRLIRALEIVKSLGFVPEAPAPTLRRPTTFYIMHPTRVVLDTRIATRLTERLTSGMQDEAHYLRTLPLASRDYNRLGIEYDEMNKQIEEGFTDEELYTRMLSRIKKYARRQITWCKKYTLYSHVLVPVE